MDSRVLAYFSLGSTTCTVVYRRGVPHVATCIKVWTVPPARLSIMAIALSINVVRAHKMSGLSWNAATADESVAA